MRSLMAICVIGTLLETGCAMSVDERQVQEAVIEPQFLGWMQDGQVTRQQLSRRLGEPTQHYEGGRIWMYRLILIERDRVATEQEVQRLWPWMGFGYDFRNARRAKMAREGELRVIRAGQDELRAAELALAEAEYALVVVMDDSGVVRRHSLVRGSRP
jgi:hypothetical protein